MSLVKEHPEVVVVVVLPPVVEVEEVPLRAALTFAIVALLAPNEERSERIDWICELVNEAAFAIGANVSIDVAIASPVATAAILATAFEVTVFCITIINDLRST